MPDQVYIPGGGVLNDILLDVLDEIGRAEKKHPHWPLTLAHQILIVNEEMGEASQAALQIIEAHERGAMYGPSSDPYKHLDNEMVQVAAMAIRFLYNRRLHESPRLARDADRRS